jgi:Ca2+-binding EF-hand superfamily protein
MALRGYRNAVETLMKMLCNRQMVWCLVSGAALATTAAYAGDDEARASLSGNHEMKMMDKDHDGKLSASEHAAGAKKMFETMDADHDGRVTADEMDAAHKHMPSGHADARADTKGDKAMKSSAAKIKTIDTDGDGAISAEEHAAGSKKMFQKMDKDGSGTLSAAEIQAGHQKMLTAEEQ